MNPSADPFKDTDVIDKRAARVAQGFVFLMTLMGILISPVFWAVMAIQLLVGIVFGRQFCLPCLFYYKVVQPKTGEGEIEDSRPVKFANKIGFLFLSLAFLANIAGLSLVGYILAALVLVLSLIAATTGFCAGCFIYKLKAKSVQGQARTDVFYGQTVLFSHPLCLACQLMKRDFPDAVVVNVSREKELAEKHKVLVVPTLYKFREDGTLKEEIIG